MVGLWRCRRQIGAVLTALETDRANRRGPFWFERLGHADLNAAAAALQPLAAADLDSLKIGMAEVGKACCACHSANRMKE